MTMTREEYMEAVVPLAALYVEAIHDSGPTAASEILEALYAIPRPPGVVASRALLTVVAAMVDYAGSVTEQLAWARSLHPTPCAQIPPVNPFAVELALAGHLTARHLTEDQARAVTAELALNRSWTPTQIADHLDADLTDVTRWISTARARRSRTKRPA